MMMGSGENEALGQMGMISSLPLQLNVAAIAGDVVSVAQKEERVPQWTRQETRDFIVIRAELERDFNLAKWNKTLWEAVVARMRERV